MYNLDNYEQVPIGATIKDGAIYALNVNSPLKFPVDKNWIGITYKEGMYWVANPIEQPVTDLLREPAEFPDCDGSFNPIQPDYYRNADGSDIIDAMVNEYGPKAAIYFCVGNSRKYIKRAGNKAGNSTEQDLRKANEFLSRAAMIAIKHLKD